MKSISETMRSLPSFSFDTLKEAAVKAETHLRSDVEELRSALKPSPTTVTTSRALPLPRAILIGHGVTIGAAVGGIGGLYGGAFISTSMSPGPVSAIVGGSVGMLSGAVIGGIVGGATVARLTK